MVEKTVTPNQGTHMNIRPNVRGKIGHITTCVGHVYPRCFLVEFPDESVGCFMGTELEVNSYNYVKESV